MIKIQAIGSPFNIEHSSCSTMTPRTFIWSKTQQKIQIYIDGGIIQGTKTPYHEQKYAWICESRFIGSAKVIRQQLLTNKEQILSKYKYLFTCDKELCCLDNRIKWTYAGSNLPWSFSKKIEYTIPEKTKLVSMICSPKDYSDGHKFRLKIAKELQPYLDLYGGAHGSIRPGEGSGPHRDKKEAIDSYMFSVVIENDSYSSYFTEKITDCFAKGTVPIYYGDPEICNYFDCSGIIKYKKEIIKTLDKKLYTSMETSINNNMNIINNMLMSEDYFYINYIKNNL